MSVHWDSNETLGNEQDENYTKNVTCCFNKFCKYHLRKQQLHDHFPLISQIIQARRTRLAWHCCRSLDILLWTPTYGHTSVGRPAKNYINQLSADTGCRLMDLPKAMNDRDGWWERVKGIYAISMTWWRWWVLILSRYTSQQITTLNQVFKKWSDSEQQKSGWVA